MRPTVDGPAGVFKDTISDRAPAGRWRSLAAMQLLAPIVAVTVHPERARITRRGRATVGAGAAELVVADLPTTLLDESVRVAGRSAAAARVLGVDLR